MKVHITTDEWYPVCIIAGEGYGVEVEVPDEVVARFRDAESAFSAANAELLTYYNAYYAA